MFSNNTDECIVLLLTSIKSLDKTKTLLLLLLLATKNYDKEEKQSNNHAIFLF
jgi:hypothetical protein